MKKRRLIIFLLAGLLCSCNSSNSNFDESFYTVCDNLKNENITAVNKVSDYYYSIDNLNLKIEAYYTRIEENYTDALVVLFSYIDTRYENVKICIRMQNEANVTISQVGFNYNTINIDEMNVKENNDYKGVQLILTPYSNQESKVTCYFECKGFIGVYFSLSDVVKR